MKIVLSDGYTVNVPDVVAMSKKQEMYANSLRNTYVLDNQAKFRMISEQIQSGIQSPMNFSREIRACISETNAGEIIGALKSAGSSEDGFSDVDETHIANTKYSYFHAEFVVITPEVAKEYLTHSIGNRNVRSKTVDAYARDMAANKWYENGEAIVFDKDGFLRNGHHRLTACIKAGVPFRSLVIYGLEPKECDEYDSGANRSFKDRMILNGSEKWRASGNIISIVRLHFRMNGIMKPTDSEIESFMNRNNDALAWCYGSFSYKAKKNSKKAGVALAIFYAKISGLDSGELVDFATSIDTGLYDISKGTAVYRLLRDLDTIEGTVGGGKSQKIILIGTENAIKDFVGRKDRHKTYFTNTKPVWSDTQMIKNL